MKTPLYTSASTLSLLALTVAMIYPAFTNKKAFAAPVPQIKSTPTKTASRSWVTLKAAIDQRRYTSGQPIKVRLTATNTAKRGAYLRFSSGQRFDFSVLPAGQKEPVYTWSATRMFLQSLGALWLKPGQSQAYEATIGDEMGQLKPGRYQLRARLTNVPHSITATPIEFEVTGPAISMTARTDKTRYKIGEAVQIHVTATNLAAEAMRMHFDSGLECDVIISNEAGTVWNYGANLRFIRALGDVTWKEGGTKTYSVTWNGVPLPREVPAELQPGRYRIEAILQSTPPHSAPPVSIDIVR